jgi:cbb3-type cytochrome oxidase cytochrome c subunit
VSVIGPSLRRIGAKLDPGWMVRWIENPHLFRPRTRMPNFQFDEQQAVQIAAFVLSTARQASDEWQKQHPDPRVDPAAVGRGKVLIESLGCRGCHALAPDEIAGQLGADKDIAPNLSAIAEKTDARWIYNWIKNPRGYSANARMPNLRLSDDEARSITAYLTTLGERKPAPPDLDARLADAANVAAGEKLVRSTDARAATTSPGWRPSRGSASSSTFGSKTKEEPSSATGPTSPRPGTTGPTTS